MKRFHLHRWQALIFTLLIAFNLPTHAEDKMVELAVERGCLICHLTKHDPETQIKMAPSYEEVAARYMGNADAAEYLTKRVLEGTVNGKQNWRGNINMRFMPPNVNVSKVEADALVNWILDIKNKPISPKLIEHERMLALAIQSGCTVCHTVDKDTDHRHVPLAPSYREIAARFGDQKGSREILLDAVVNGTMDKEKTWKNVNMRFMPPNPSLSKENAEKLVDWILDLK